MGDPGSEIIESVPPAGPEASEATTDENEDDIQFVSEGPLRPVLEYIDLVSSDDEEPSTSHSDENVKHKDYIDRQKDKVALTLARLARHVEVEKQQKEEKNRAFREKVDFQHAHGLQELEFIREHSDTEAARLCVDQWLKMPGLKTGTINCGTRSSSRRGGQMRVSGKPISCPIMHCNKEFDNGHLLLGHLKRFDHSPCDPTITLRGPFISSFACIVCCKKFVTQQQYRDHLFTKLSAIACDRWPKSLGPCTHGGRPGRSSWLLALDRCSSGHCGHLGSEPLDGRSLSLPLSVTLSQLPLYKPWHTHLLFTLLLMELGELEVAQQQLQIQS